MSEAIKIPIHICEETPKNEVFIGSYDTKICPFCFADIIIAANGVDAPLKWTESNKDDLQGVFIVDDPKPRHLTIDEQRIFNQALRDSATEILTTPFVENGCVKEVEK